jgi:ABC-type transporter Mla subunit MlaD
MKSRKRQMMAAVLAAVVTAGNAPLSYGAPAAVETDETMYVNLDVYGKAQKVNVVKSCSLNGVTDFTDYGNYLAVENMSTQDEPQLGEGEVVWKLPPDRRERFYYKCTLDQEQTALPWNFDVSYKLNGVPTDGEKLAGASGLVEIHIKAEPNEQADLYYRNNMLLLVAVPVDMSKCFSVEAEGSQTQNMGELTAVVFTALPGEEGDYTVRIGSDSFETTGVIMAMTPGTVEDLEHIKDLKEAKDTWQDAGDELYDSLEQMAQSIEDMRGGVDQMQSGLNAAENARQKWSSSKDAILAGNDRSLESLRAMSGQLETLVPHLQTAKEEAEIVHKSMGDIVGTLGEMQEPLGKLYTRLRNIKSSTASMGEQLPDLRDDLSYLIETNASFQVQTTEALEALGQLIGELEEYDDEALEIEVPEIEIPEAQGEEELEEPEVSEPEGSEKPEESEEQEKPEGSEEPEAPDASEPEKDENLEINEPENENTGSQTISRAVVPKAQIEKREVPFVASSGSQLQQLMQMLRKIDKDSRKFTQTAGNLMEDISDSAQYSADLVDNMDFLIEDLTALYDSLDTYYPDLQSALDDLSALTERTTEALNSTTDTLTLVQNTLKASSDEMDVAAKDSLMASMELLNKSLNVLDSTAGIRRAGRTMKDVIDSQLDKFDTENRFLFMDPDAEKVSFTSSKNPEPRTLQVVLRTDEISLENEEHKTLDAETEEPEVSPLKRMWNVLVKMWRSLVDIFKNR